MQNDEFYNRNTKTKLLTRNVSYDKIKCPVDTLNLEISHHEIITKMQKCEIAFTG